MAEWFVAKSSEMKDGDRRIVKTKTGEWKDDAFFIDVIAWKEMADRNKDKARKGVPVVVDNTFATPVCQQPFALGADLVVHSVTKYLAGHSDLIQGAVLARDADVFAPVKFLQNAIGAVPAGFAERYAVLQEAQAAATAYARAGVSCEAVDAAARDVLDAAGFELVFPPFDCTQVDKAKLIGALQGIDGTLASVERLSSCSRRLSCQRQLQVQEVRLERTTLAERMRDAVVRRLHRHRLLRRVREHQRPERTPLDQEQRAEMTIQPAR